ncbi:MAG: hypothetical protein M0C28_35605 [Candidatus Moduliflexus flocculans]|nr:hypothetical protein [Candidatus Moduliflexus flocculans]
MTSRERVQAVLAGEVPDRVPAWLGASPEWKALAKARAGLATDEELSLFVGDDFRRVFAKYAGPPGIQPGLVVLPPRSHGPHALRRRADRLRLRPARQPPPGGRADGRRHRALPLARSGLDGRLRASATRPWAGAGGSPSWAATGRRSTTTRSTSWAWRASWSRWSRARPSSTSCSGAWSTITSG